MSASRGFVLLWSLAACSSGEPVLGDTFGDTFVDGGLAEVSWLTGWDVRWDLFNHRVSHLALRFDEDRLVGGFVGGASTTGRTFDPDGTCLNVATCWEIPLDDTWAVRATTQTGSAGDGVVLGTGVAGGVTAPGGVVRLEVAPDWPAGAPLPDAAWIRGFAITADIPLDTDVSCYDARHGWLIRTLAVEVQPAEATDAGPVIPVDVTVEGGLSFEAQRACLDAVVGLEQVSVTVQLVAYAGNAVPAERVVAQSAFWPGPQDVQDVTELDAGTAPISDSAAVGWSAWRWQFHRDVEPGRGAYLRSLGVSAEPDADTALGWATNTSPGSMLSGFDFDFEGVLTVVDDLELGVTTATVIDEGREVRLTEEGVPVDTAVTAP